MLSEHELTILVKLTRMEKLKLNRLGAGASLWARLDNIEKELRAMKKAYRESVQSLRLAHAGSVATATKMSKMPSVPKNYEVQPLKPGELAEDRATCGVCGRSWDDGKITSMTPAPSGRCPFESFHPEDR